MIKHIYYFSVILNKLFFTAPEKVHLNYMTFMKLKYLKLLSISGGHPLF